MTDRVIKFDESLIGAEYTEQEKTSSYSEDSYSRRFKTWCLCRKVFLCVWARKRIHSEKRNTLTDSQ